MSMTREEAIKLLKQYQGYDPMFPDGETLKHAFDLTDETVDTLLSALRPVSREQVEKVFPGCKMCSGWNKIKLKPCANGDLGVQADIGSAGKGDTFGLVVYNHLLASGYVDFPFCPFCGKPLTDEAVEMVMERMDELQNEIG